jgi:hypothetical protein
MKKLPVIIVIVLGCLSAAAFILFIIVFINTSEWSVDIPALLQRAFPRTRESAASESPIPIPDRFKPARETATADTTAAPPADSAVAVPATARYPGNYACGTMLDADDMLLLILGNNLFCKRSRWSRQWNNPGGKGIRLGSDGLCFTDSTVADSLTGIVWQHFSEFPSLIYSEIDGALAHLNSIRWQGFDTWRAPTIEEIMTLLVPRRNRHGLYLPGNWDCNVRDIWSCSPACDSLSTQWLWVGRMAMGRCNYGHPGIPRALLAVRKLE